MSRIEGRVLDGHVFVDAAAVVQAIRIEADRHEQRAQSVGDPVPDGRWDESVAAHTVAAVLRQFADRLDVACVAHVTH